MERFYFSFSFSIEMEKGGGHQEVLPTRSLSEFKQNQTENFMSTDPRWSLVN